MCDLLKKKAEGKPLSKERLVKETQDGGYADKVVGKILGPKKEKDLTKEVLGR